MAADYRIGLNAVGADTRQYVTEWAAAAAGLGHTVYVFHTPINRYKYPMMRRMLYPPAPTPSQYVMWFDDDSYLTLEDPDWMNKVAGQAENHDMIGQAGWEIPLRASQWQWVMAQPWFNDQVGPPTGRSNRPALRFVQGGWWVANRDFLFRHNYPWPELRHNGGDSMLGEMCRHVGARICKFDDGVRINADAEGNHSKAPRRGDKSDERIGSDYVPGKQPDVSHQTFVIETQVFSPETINADTSSESGRNADAGPGAQAYCDSQA